MIIQVVLHRTVVVDSDCHFDNLGGGGGGIELRTLKITTAQVVNTSVTVNNNSPIQEHDHPDDHTQPTEYEMTPGFKPFTIENALCTFRSCHCKTPISR